MQLYEQIEKAYREEIRKQAKLATVKYGTSIQLEEDFHISFLKQSFIKFLEEQCNVIASKKKPVTFVMGKSQSAYSADDAYNMAIIDQIDYYQNMIKELQV